MTLMFSWPWGNLYDFGLITFDCYVPTAIDISSDFLDAVAVGGVSQSVSHAYRACELVQRVSFALY